MRLQRDERGMVLPLTLMALLVIASLTAVLLSIGTSEVAVSANHLRSTQALFLAESGLEDAFNTLRDTPAMTATAPTALTAMPGLSGASPTLAAFGTYSVQYQKAGGNTVRLISTGTVANNGGTRTLTAVLTNNFTSSAAILTQSSFSISGSPNVAGTCGTIHSNGSLTVTGHPSISQDLTSSGSYSASGTPAVGGMAGGGQPTRSVPSIVPAEFLAAAQAQLAASTIFQFKANGQVLDGHGNLLLTLASGDTYRGWRFTPGTPSEWVVAGNTADDGTYYMEGSARVSGSPGNPTTPWRATVIATGDIEISGSPEIQTHLPDTLFVAGYDVRVSGSPTLGFNGLIAAHEQIAITGNATISGFIIAEGASSVSGTITANETNGNAEITFNCGSVSSALRGSLRVLSWGM
jgi:Tfp pilus assembly protein PilX